MITGNDDDPDLQRAIAELQAGRRVELNSRRVFESYYRWVRRFFDRLGYSAEDGEDLAQETFGQVFDRIGSYRSEGSFRSWVFAIAANLHRGRNRWRRREKRHAPEVSLDSPADPDTPALEVPGGERSPAQAAYEKERREALARAFQSLPPQMRQVLLLRVDQDLKYREIAEVLQISIETVKAHLFQARQRLRAELGEDHGEWME